MRTMYCLLAMIVVSLSWPQVGRAAEYVAASGQSYSLSLWQGDHIDLYASWDYQEQPRDDVAMQLIVESLDKAHECLSYVTGTSKGRIEVAAIPISPQNAAQAYPGGNIIEVQPGIFDQVYAYASKDIPEYHQVVYYELGRCFDKYSDKLGHDWGTALAILMRFYVMEKCELNGAPFHGFDFERDFKRQFIGLEETYSNSRQLRWASVCANDEPLHNLDGNKVGLGGADLKASTIWYLASNYGGDQEGKTEFLRRFFDAAGRCGVADDTEVNLIRCVAYAADKPVVQVQRACQARWRWRVR